MSDGHPPASEAVRLERLWAGPFGDDYVDRNATGFEARRPFWSTHLQQYPSKRVLEIGCNIGGNLGLIADEIGPANCYGVDVNHKALATLHGTYPQINAVACPARQLPFRDSWFDLTFTIGVLIHQPESTLPLVMAEMVRCSGRWIMCGEYHSSHPTEVEYRDQRGALIKRDFGALFLNLFPELTLLKTTFVGREEKWDDVTIWLFSKEIGSA